MILKTKYPKREINFEEVQLFAPLYYCCEALCNICDETNDFVNDFLGFENECFSEDMPVMFKPEDSWKSAPQKAPVPSKKPAAVSESHDVYETKNLLAEIESLRQKLHSQEQATRHSHSLYEQIKKEKDELTSSLHQYENEHQELIALRNHVYQSTEADIPVSPVSLEDMEQEIEQKHIVIIGGHSNWTNKLKNRFKKWVFLSPDTSGSVDNRILNQADYVFFFTDIIKHSTYLRFVRIVREKGIPFGYLHSIHIPMNVREIYGEVVER